MEDHIRHGADVWLKTGAPRDDGSTGRRVALTP